MADLTEMHVHAAKQGDVESAIFLIEMLIKRLEEDEPLPTPLKDFFLPTFQEIVKQKRQEIEDSASSDNSAKSKMSRRGGIADRALCLIGKQGRPAYDIGLALEVVETVDNAMAKGLSKTKAFEAASKSLSPSKFGLEQLSYDTIESIYKAYKKKLDAARAIDD